MARLPRQPLSAPAAGENAVNAVPPMVLVLFLVIAAVEGVLSLADLGAVGGPGGAGWRLLAIERFGFSPAVLDVAWERGGVDAGLLARFGTYAFVHGGTLHALFGGALLLALGKFVGDAMGGLAAVAVFGAATILGALTFGLIVDGGQPLYGCYPGVYGLIGAFTYMMWLHFGRTGGNRLRAFRLIGMLLAIQLGFGLLFGSGPGWVADIGGFAGGLAVATLVAPGGWAALRARLRAR